MRGSLSLDQDRQRRSSVASKIPGIFKHSILKFLEKFIHRMKLIALKFHNMSNEWVRNIRKRRQQVELEVTAKESNPVDMVSIEDDSEEHEKGEVHPMVKSTVVHPDVKIGEQSQQSQLENILIRRIAINPKDIEAYERLGDYYNEQSNLPDALECYKQVLKLSPMHHKARAKVRSIEKIIG